jgi:hypothetical protein
MQGFTEILIQLGVQLVVENQKRGRFRARSLSILLIMLSPAFLIPGLYRT